MFKGSMPALVTPFNNGKVDIDALKKLVDWHVDQGSHGLVPVGTTGESPTLTHAEHDLVVQTVVQAAAGRIPVIAGAGSNNTVETVRLVEAAKKAGADAALVVILQQTNPSRPDRAFHGCGKLWSADHHLQHSGSVCRGHVARDNGQVGRIADDRGRERCDWRSVTRAKAADALRERLCATVRRRCDGAWVQRARRGRMYLGHSQHRG
jgi:hypothetical protein